MDTDGENCKGRDRSTQLGRCPTFFVPLLIFTWVGPCYRAMYWEAVLVTGIQYVEGHRLPDEARVC